MKDNRQRVERATPDLRSTLASSEKEMGGEGRRGEEGGHVLYV